jgi:hypothetical protein
MTDRVIQTLAAHLAALAHSLRLARSFHPYPGRKAPGRSAGKALPLTNYHRRAGAPVRPLHRYYLRLPHVVYSIGQDMQLNLADRHLAELGLTGTRGTPTIRDTDGCAGGSPRRPRR